MNKMTTLFALAAALSLFACGDDKKAVDAGTVRDSTTVDGAAPPTPALGAQIDRMGRPAINTALNHTFDVNAAAKGSAKDAYNQDTAIATWPQTWAVEFTKNLALIDALDAATGSNGCGNQVLYNGNPGGGSAAMGGSNNSYLGLAGILANDQLYLDTSKGSCTHYLAVEFGVVIGAGNSTCGGRAPSYDVIDVSYSALAIGLAGFTLPPALAPLFGDNVGPHADASDTTFPFLGAPH
jgi:hypothetical protein